MNNNNNNNNIPRTQLVLNGLMVLLVCWALVSTTRMAHMVQPKMLIGFLPTVSWAVCSRSPESRALRGFALLFNGMLGIGGLGGLVLVVFGTAAPRPALEFWGLVLFGLLFTAVAGVNIHAVSTSSNNKAPAPQARGD